MPGLPHCGRRAVAGLAMLAAPLRLYPNEAMTENLAYYPRHGYTETHRAQQAGFHRVYFRKPLDS